MNFVHSGSVDVSPKPCFGIHPGTGDVECLMCRDESACEKTTVVRQALEPRTCADCGQLISQELLEILPDATKCALCQDQGETVGETTHHPAAEETREVENEEPVTCEACGEAIRPERLAVCPDAKRCVACQELIEAQGKTIHPRSRETAQAEASEIDDPNGDADHAAAETGDVEAVGAVQGEDADKLIEGSGGGDETIRCFETRTVDDLIVTDRFSNLMPKDPTVLEKITKDMAENGYNWSYPLTLFTGEWIEGGCEVLGDGHTRREAAIANGLKELPVVVHKTATEQDAVYMALAAQFMKRPQTDALRLHVLSQVDHYKKRGGQKRQSGAKGKSAEDLVQIIGMSARSIERMRTVLKYAEFRDKVRTGAISIHAAYLKITKGRKSEGTPRTDPPPSQTGNSDQPESKKVKTSPAPRGDTPGRLNWISAAPKWLLEGLQKRVGDLPMAESVRITCRKGEDRYEVAIVPRSKRTKALRP